MKHGKSKLLLLLLCLTGFSAWGQSDAQFEQYLKLREKTEKKGENKGFWTVSLTGGVSLFQGEWDSDAKKVNLLTPYGKLNVARWFSSVWGLRWEASGGTQKNGLVRKNEPDTKGKFYFADSYLTVITNVMNWGTYKRANRPVGVYLFMGGGCAWTPARDNIPSQLSPAVIIGGELNFRLTDYWSLSLGAEGTIVKDHFNGYTGGRKYEGYVGATAGLVYRFP